MNIINIYSIKYQRNTIIEFMHSIYDIISLHITCRELLTYTDNVIKFIQTLSNDNQYNKILAISGKYRSYYRYICNTLHKYVDKYTCYYKYIHNTLAVIFICNVNSYDRKLLTLNRNSYINYEEILITQFIDNISQNNIQNYHMYIINRNIMRKLTTSNLFVLLLALYNINIIEGILSLIVSTVLYILAERVPYTTYEIYKLFNRRMPYITPYECIVLPLNCIITLDRKYMKDMMWRQINLNKINEYYLASGYYLEYYDIYLKSLFDKFDYPPLYEFYNIYPNSTGKYRTLLRQIRIYISHGDLASLKSFHNNYHFYPITDLLIVSILESESKDIVLYMFRECKYIIQNNILPSHIKECKKILSRDFLEYLYFDKFIKINTQWKLSINSRVKQDTVHTNLITINNIILKNSHHAYI